MSDPSKQIATFFSDVDASDAVVLAANNVTTPMIQGTPLTVDERMTGGGVRVAFFILDMSPSMYEVSQALRDGFNNDFVTAVKEAREDDISALRIGGVAFSSGSPHPIWVGANGDHFHKLENLPGLTTVDYDPRMGSGTDLHRAILEGSAQAFKYAADLQRTMGMAVDVDIIILSDGANNGPPLDSSGVKQIVTGRRNRVRFVFFYFQTDYGLKDPKTYATTQLGISAEQVESFMKKSGETPKQQASRFRRLMAVMSRVSAARSTSAVVAKAAVPDDDEEII